MQSVCSSNSIFVIWGKIIDFSEDKASMPTWTSCIDENIRRQKPLLRTTGRARQTRLCGDCQASLYSEHLTIGPTDPSPNPRDGTRHRDTSQSSSRNCGHRAAGFPAYLWSVHNTAGRRFGASHAGPHVFPMPIVRTVRQCAKSYPPSLPCPTRGRGD